MVRSAARCDCRGMFKWVPIMEMVVRLSTYARYQRRGGDKGISLIYILVLGKTKKQRYHDIEKLDERMNEKILYFRRLLTTQSIRFKTLKI